MHELRSTELRYPSGADCSHGLHRFGGRVLAAGDSLPAAETDIASMAPRARKHWQTAAEA